MITELDCVALKVARPEHGLAAGDVGAVVHTWKNGRDYDVEFVTFDGKTVAIVKLAAAEIRPLAQNDIHHARPFQPAGR